MNPLAKTFTKSIRLTEEESREIERIASLLMASSEASVIKQAYLRGLAEIKLEAAASRYTQGDLSVGEAAELYGLSPADLMQELLRRRITVIDADPDDLSLNLHRLRRRLVLDPQR